MKKKFLSFQNMILKLQKYWLKHGCVIIQPLDIEVGAGTYHYATFLRALGHTPWSAAYVQPSRRPSDGRYGIHPTRAQHYYQFQVVIKPSPNNIQDLYLSSLKNLGIDFLVDDLRFVEDNWESPTLGACGLGWEVILNNLEISQFTYFQQMGGLECDPVTVEVTYGLERIAMHIQNKEDIYQILWTDVLTYGEIFLRNEIEMSHYNFTHADTYNLFNQFIFYESECTKLLKHSLIIPAYEIMLKASHTFNLLDSRGVISVDARQGYILRIRSMACEIAKNYHQLIE